MLASRPAALRLAAVVMLSGLVTSACGARLSSSQRATALSQYNGNGGTSGGPAALGSTDGGTTGATTGLTTGSGTTTGTLKRSSFDQSWWASRIRNVSCSGRPAGLTRSSSSAS